MMQHDFDLKRVTKLAQGNATVQREPGYLLVLPWRLTATGGVSQVVKNLYRELKDLEWEPEVLQTDWSAKSPQRSHIGEYRGILWRVRSPVDAPNRLWALATFMLTFPGFVWSWLQLLKCHHYSVVNFHYPTPIVYNWILMKKLRLWRGIIIVSVHGKEVRDALNQGATPYARLMKRCLLGADAIIACAEELRDDVGALVAPGSANVEVVPNGVAPDLLRKQLVAAPPIPDVLRDRPYILNIATFEYKKGQDILIEAFAELSKHHRDVDLVMIGRSSPWLSQLVNLTRQLGISQHIHFYTDLPHELIPAFLHGSSIFCLPSRSEGHPLVVLEAAVMGIPVIATPVGGTSQTITDASFGELVDVGDVNMLSEAMAYFLGNPTEAKAVASNLKQRVENCYTWAQTALLYDAHARKSLASG